MQDPEFQDLYCAWADERWPEDSPFQEVKFDIGYHGPYSELTPDVDTHIEIGLKCMPMDKWIYKEMEITEVISSLLKLEREKYKSKS